MRINIEMNKGLRTVRKKAWVMKGAFLSFVLSLVVVFLLAGSVSAGAPFLHVEYVNDLIEASTAIYNNTGKIADDTKLDEGLRAKAEEIHVASRELGNIAEVIHEHVKELEGLISDPEVNKAKIKEALDEVVGRLEECYAILEAKDDLVHAILAVTPESHKEYADAIHDTYHEAGRIVEKFTEHAQELAKLVGVAIPGSAIKPVAVPEQFIRMYDKKGKLQNLLAEEVAVEAHGHLCVCGATAFRVTQVAISQLWGEEIPAKGVLELTYHHPGKGHKEVFEYLLGSENITYVKAGDPKHLTLEDNFIYTFIRKNTGATWETVMKEGVISAGFFDLRYEVKGFLKGWHEEKPTKLEKAAFKQQFDEAVNNVLSMKASEIFEGVGVGSAPTLGAEAKTVLTIVKGTETKALTLDEIKATLPYTASGGLWATHRGVVKGPFEYTGVKLTDLLDLVGGISEENTVKVVASDGFAKVFTYDQIKGDLETFDREGNSIGWDQPITVVLAYEQDGNPIEIPKGGPLKIAITGPEEPITPGDCWVKWLEKIEIEETAP